MALSETQLYARVPQETRDKLQAWLDEQNVGRRTQLKMSDLIRGVMEHAVEVKLKWEKGGGS